MPAIINRRDAIKSKGVDYFIYHGVNEDGEGVTLFLNKAQEEEFGAILLKAVATPDVIQDMFKGRDTVDVQFNQRGRLVSVS